VNPNGFDSDRNRGQSVRQIGSPSGNGVNRDPERVNDFSPSPPPSGNRPPPERTFSPRSAPGLPTPAQYEPGD
jgi:hypothetical protein